MASHADIGGVRPGTNEGARTIQSPSPAIASASGISMAIVTSVPPVVQCLIGYSGLRAACVAAYRYRPTAVNDLAAAARVLGIDHTGLRCLEILLVQQTVLPSQLGGQLGLTSGSVTTMLDRLELQGYDLTGSSCARAACASAAFWRSSAFAALPRQLSAMDADMGSGKISSCPFSTPSKVARATDSAEALGMSKPRVMSVSVGPVKTPWTRTPRPARRARSDWVKENAAALE